nr:hypothetical protein BaRGS_026639 [Batillaria attramentaria]
MLVTVAVGNFVLLLVLAHEACGATARARRSHALRLVRDTMDATAYCTTEECVQMMQQYEQWRAENGYGTVGRETE